MFEQNRKYYFTITSTHFLSTEKVFDFAFNRLKLKLGATKEGYFTNVVGHLPNNPKVELELVRQFTTITTKVEFNYEFSFIVIVKNDYNSSSF